MGVVLLEEGSYSRYTDCGGSLQRYLNPSSGPCLIKHFGDLPESLPPFAAAVRNQHAQDPRGRALAVLGMLDTDPSFFEEKIIERVLEISPPDAPESDYWWLEDQVVFYGLRGLAFRAREGSEEARAILEAMSYPDYWQERVPSGIASDTYIWPMVMALAFMDCVTGRVAIMDMEATKAAVDPFARTATERMAAEDIEPYDRMDLGLDSVLRTVWMACTPDDEWMRRIIRERREAWHWLGEQFVSGKLEGMRPPQTPHSDER